MLASLGAPCLKTVVSTFTLAQTSAQHPPPSLHADGIPAVIADPTRAKQNCITPSLPCVSLALAGAVTCPCAAPLTPSTSFVGSPLAPVLTLPVFRILLVRVEVCPPQHRPLRSSVLSPRFAQQQNAHRSPNSTPPAAAAPLISQQRSFLFSHYPLSVPSSSRSLFALSFLTPVSVNIAHIAPASTPLFGGGGGGGLRHLPVIPSSVHNVLCHERLRHLSCRCLSLLRAPTPWPLRFHEGEPSIEIRNTKIT